MNTRRSTILTLVMLAGALIYSAYYYPRMPDTVPIHWNTRGEVDGYGPKWISLFLMPGVMALMAAMQFGLPAMSPRGYDIAAFRPTFNYVMVLLTGMMAYLHVVIVQASLRPQLDVGRLICGGIFIAFALMGNVLGRVKRNFWMGIRTPWTLASERVWTSTHRFGARVMFWVGLLGALATLAGARPELYIWALVIASLAPVLYSYLYYKKIGGDSE